MDQKRLRTAKRAKVSPRPWHLGTALAGFCLLLSLAAESVPNKRRTTHFALPANGAIGAWLIGGPCPDLRAASSGIQPGNQPACEGAEWRSMANASGDFDWAETLNVPANAPAAAVAGFWMQFEKPFDGWLLVAADGMIRVAVDGRWVHRREKPRQRGRALVPIPLSLGVGFHSIALGLERVGNRSNLSALLRDRQTNQAPSDALVYLPGGPAVRRLTEQLTSLSVQVRGPDPPLELEIKLAFPSGVVAADLPVEVELHSGNTVPARRWKAGVVVGKSASKEPFTLHLGPLERLVSAKQSTLLLRIGDAVLRRALWLTPTALASLARAQRVKILPFVQTAAQSRHDDLGATLQAHMAQVSERMVQPGREPLVESVKRLDELVTLLEQGKSPFARSGFVDAFIRSPFDQRPTSVMTYAPEGDRAVEGNPKPLVVALHGFNGSPRGILDAFLDVKNGKPARKIDGFVLAPAAHGNTFYRGPGENAVLDALDWAMVTYPIDPTRISITGVSMGGTGAAEIAFHHSQVFAAAAPLCGYHSYFVRRDIANKPLRPWERRLMHQFSPASLAESGNDIPLFVAQGKKDQPLENSKVLTTRYRALAYDLTEDWPNLGHSVWTKTYRDAALYFWLTKWKKDADPAHVVLACSSLAHNKKFWIELTELGSTEEPSLLDGRILSPTEVEIRTRGVAAFRVGPSRHLDPNRAIQVKIDDTLLSVEAGIDRHFAGVDGTWRLSPGSASGGVPVRRMQGPWSEIFSQPVAVIYGSGDPNTTALNREIATRLVAPRAGVDLRIPILSDRDFFADSSPLARLIYVGRFADHSHLAKIGDRLPLRSTQSGIELGALRFQEPDVGAAFVYPDPDRPERLLGIVTGNGPEGLWRVLALPALVPDFVVFDHGTDPAAGEPILGRDAFFRAAGFFRSDWSLPANVLDPLAPKPR